MTPVSLKEHLEKIHSFAVIARAGSFRKASSVLRRTQPSLSRSVQVLEDALGVTLFERTRLGVHPTPAGLELLELSARISNEVSRTEHRLKSRSQGICAKLFVGSYESLAIRIWPALVREVSRKSPGIAITVKTDCEDDRMLQMVRSSKLDLALTISPSPYSDLESRGIYSDSFAVYCAPKLAKKAFGGAKCVSLSKLGQVPFVSVPNATVPSATHGERQSLERLATKLGIIQEQLIHELDSFEAAKEFIIEGVGVGLLPRWVAQPAIAQGRIEPLRVSELSGPIGQHTIHAIFRKSDMANAAVLSVVREAQRLTRIESRDA